MGDVYHKPQKPLYRLSAEPVPLLNLSKELWPGLLSIYVYISLPYTFLYKCRRQYLTLAWEHLFPHFSLWQFQMVQITSPENVYLYI